MKLFFSVILFVVVVVSTACGNSTATAQQPIATSHATQASIKPTPAPTGQAVNPVCNAKVTNTPCVQFASIQDAAVGESEVGANVHTGISKGIVWVEDDITNVKPSALGPATTLDQIQYQCFNIQQGLWYGLKSTINADGSQTIRKSAFSEVDITFIDHHKGNVAFASCRLTSAGVDKIDNAFFIGVVKGGTDGRRAIGRT